MDIREAIAAVVARRRSSGGSGGGTRARRVSIHRLLMSEQRRCLLVDRCSGRHECLLGSKAIGSFDAGAVRVERRDVGRHSRHGALRGYRRCSSLDGTSRRSNQRAWVANVVALLMVKVQSRGGVGGRIAVAIGGCAVVVGAGTAAAAAGTVVDRKERIDRQRRDATGASNVVGRQLIERIHQATRWWDVREWSIAQHRSREQRRPAAGHERRLLRRQRHRCCWARRYLCDGKQSAAREMRYASGSDATGAAATTARARRLIGVDQERERVVLAQHVRARHAARYRVSVVVVVVVVIFIEVVVVRVEVAEVVLDVVSYVVVVVVVVVEVEMERDAVGKVCERRREEQVGARRAGGRCRRWQRVGERTVAVMIDRWRGRWRCCGCSSSGRE